MNEKLLIEFLEKFDIEKNIISEFLKNKKILEKNKNIFLIPKNDNFIKNQVYSDLLILIDLNSFLPSKFLLKFIRENTNNLIEISNEKQALNFTYSKKILIESTKNPKARFNLDKSYIVIYKNNILGYAKFVNKNGNFYFENEMNIGDYLKEN